MLMNIDIDIENVNLPRSQVCPASRCALSVPCTVRYVRTGARTDWTVSTVPYLPGTVPGTGR
jgi:hypothetical protein